MDIASTISLLAGGPGSGCQGPNCGRPVLYHGTLAKNVSGIAKNGLKARIPAAAKGMPEPEFERIVSAIPDKNQAISWALGKADDYGQSKVAVVVIKPSAGFKKGGDYQGEWHKNSDLHQRHIRSIEIYDVRDLEKGVKKVWHGGWYDPKYTHIKPRKVIDVSV